MSTITRVMMPSTIPFTKGGYAQIVAEQKRLRESRPEAVENLRKSREMGDLSENGYYKAARARLSGLDARLRYIDRLVKLGRVVSATQTDRVEIGSKVSVLSDGKEYTYTIVGGYESDPAKQTISYLSPVGRALMGKHVGEPVSVETPSGVRTMKIETIL